MKKYLLYLLLLCSIPCWSQTTIVTQQFSSVAPSGWSSTTSSWNFTYNASTTGNSLSGTYSARLSSASTGNGKYIYIPVTVAAGNTYKVKFYTKRVCGVTVNLNETANQTTLIATSSATNTSCASNFSTWYMWEVNLFSTYDEVAYIQILVGTVYGGPTSVYLDDVTITYTTPVSLPIELLFFKAYAHATYNSLKWCCATETMNWYFTVYRSEDGVVWVPIIAQPGAGTTSHQTCYQHVDYRVSDTIVYYKLTQTDFDGSEHEFDIISTYNPITPKHILYVVDISGRYVGEGYVGWVVEVYSDSSTRLMYQE